MSLFMTYPCPTDPRNLCFGPVAVDGNTSNEIRLNANVSGASCSGTRLDCNGDTWLADFGFNVSGNASTCDLAGGCPVDTSAIFGCTDAATEDIFKCEHFDGAAAPDLQYSFDVPNGKYMVNLLFMNAFTGTANAGSRTFDITIEGQLVYDNFDQVAAAGGSGIPVVRAAVVTVSDGDGLQIDFGREMENPAIKGIEILAASGACTADADCDDSNACTIDICDIGTCLNANAADATPCDDGVACTSSDVCASGQCGGVDNCIGGNCDVLTGLCGPYRLLVSQSADRSNPIPLAGETVSGNIFVFVSPEAGITQATFFLDDPNMIGPPFQNESFPPWDFAGGAAAGTANAFNADSLSPDQHMITVLLSLSIRLAQGTWSDTLP